MRRTKEELEAAVKVSNNYSDVCRYFGIVAKGDNFTKIKKEIENNNIDVSHFNTSSWNKGLRYINSGIKSLDEILIENSDYHSTKLKQRLIKSGLKEPKCECCGNTEWNGEPIPLELHHINGNHYDNRIENLQILCPNCHALTKTYRGANQDRYKNREKKAIIITEEEYKIHRKLNDNKIKREKQTKICPICGKEFTTNKKGQKYCSTQCATKSYSNKPDYEVLLKDIEEFGINQSKIAKKYNVSPNAVKKWLKSYNLYEEKYAYHNSIKKKIAQYDLDNNLIKVYDSITEAYKEHSGDIRKCLKLSNRTAYGYIWRYYTEDENS